MTGDLPSSILSLDSPAATLETAGGKGANLARLTRAGFPVPPGYIIPTQSYLDYLSSNGLAAKIQQSLAGISAEDTDALESASSIIRSAFSAGEVPRDLITALRAANTAVFSSDTQPVAVRSSATAEDLPDLSFAGQQDTYLNIIGAEQLLVAVVNCWSSLWTARAIGYRLRNGINQAGAALAVVVQRMVPSDVSGVLFTANPLTGLLSESVIDATFGLGEALVSGQVEPDHFVVDTRKGTIVSKTLGAKKTATRALSGGGVVNVAEDAAARQSLGDEQILDLATIGQQIQAEYRAPQDIEWAFSSGKLYILQSRAITSLFPIPEVSFEPLKIWFSFGDVQGLQGPMTPLGQDAIRYVISGAARIFGVYREPEDLDIFMVAGERTWVKISDVIRNPIGNRLYAGALGFLEPSVGQILRSLAKESLLGAGQGKLKLKTIRRMVGFVLRLIPRVIRNMAQPEKGRAWLDIVIDRHLAAVQIEPAGDRFGRLANTLHFMRHNMTAVFQKIMPRFAPIFGPSVAALSILKKYSGGDPSLSLQVTRSLPKNVTTEMDLALWKTAVLIKSDQEARRAFSQSTAEDLAREFLSSSLPPTAQSAVAQFMQAYGMRGIGEIDFGQPRWREEPTPIMHTLQSYLQFDSTMAPDVVFAQGEQTAYAAVEKIAAEALSQPGGKGKERQVRTAARRVRALMSARESPKFLAIRIMGIARAALLKIGQEFTKAGTIERPDDLFFLHWIELEALAHNESRDWKGLIAARRSTFEREQRRRQTPRVLVSDGRAFYGGLGADTSDKSIITGSPVSPGVVEGKVRIVLDPRTTRLLPGEILVCPGTDPAWTPLFMAAGGLITEVGGILTHGSVVAREYGIPAVVGVDQATLRLKDGQRIRLDGSLGKIMILDQPTGD